MKVGGKPLPAALSSLPPSKPPAGKLPSSSTSLPPLSSAGSGGTGGGAFGIVPARPAGAVEGSCFSACGSCWYEEPVEAAQLLCCCTPDCAVFNDCCADYATAATRFNECLQVRVVESGDGYFW